VTGTPPKADFACDRAEFVKDVSVPDNTRVSPGETFVKTGACATTAPAPGPRPMGWFLKAKTSSMPRFGAGNHGHSAAWGDDRYFGHAESGRCGRSLPSRFQAGQRLGQRFGVQDGSQPFWAQVQVGTQSGIIYDFSQMRMKRPGKAARGTPSTPDLVFGRRQR